MAIRLLRSKFSPFVHGFPLPAGKISPAKSLPSSALMTAGKVSPAKSSWAAMTSRFLAQGPGACQGLQGGAAHGADGRGAAQAVDGAGAAQGGGGGAAQGGGGGAAHRVRDSLLLVAIGVIGGSVIDFLLGYKEEDELPEEVDWEMKGAVSKPIDQLGCGSCWAIAGVGAIEGINQITWGGKFQTLSVQGVIDCAERQIFGFKIKGCGCGGGNLRNVYEYAMKHGLNLASQYPLRPLCAHGFCKDTFLPVACKITGYRQFKVTERGLMKHVARQPIPITVDSYFENPIKGYDGSLLDIDEWPPAKRFDHMAKHAVLVVGYGKDNEGNQRWKMKNSRGTFWGKGGYMYVRRGTGNKEGVGGMYRYVAYYPIIETKWWMCPKNRRWDWYGSWWCWWDV